MQHFQIWKFEFEMEKPLLHISALEILIFPTVKPSYFPLKKLSYFWLRYMLGILNDAIALFRAHSYSDSVDAGKSKITGFHTYC